MAYGSRKQSRNTQEGEMKTWIANYSVKYRNGRKTEYEITDIKANTIVDALETVKRDHTDILKNDPDVEKVVIWNIAIVEDDVFPEE